VSALKRAHTRRCQSFAVDDSYEYAKPTHFEAVDVAAALPQREESAQPPCEPAAFNTPRFQVECPRCFVDLDQRGACRACAREGR